jgi:hypothetical protein
VPYVYVVVAEECGGVGMEVRKSRWEEEEKWWICIGGRTDR